MAAGNRKKTRRDLSKAVRGDNMLECFDRFAVEKKSYVFSHATDFATCHEKVEKPTGNIIHNLDFIGERQNPVESPCELAETVCTDNANPPISQRETGEIAQEETPAIATPDSTENGEISHESKQSKGHISNFANTRLY